MPRKYTKKKGRKKIKRGGTEPEPEPEPEPEQYDTDAARSLKLLENIDTPINYIHEAGLLDMISQQVGPARYQLELKEQQITDEMIKKITTNDDLSTLINKFYPGGYETNTILTSIIQNWGRNKYKKPAFKYIYENIEIPEIVKTLYIYVIETEIVYDIPFTDSINWIECFILILMSEDGLDTFVEFIRELEDNTNPLKNKDYYNDPYWARLVGMQMEDNYIKRYTGVQKEKFLQIFLSHFRFNR